jgi:hypothetical protein
MCHKNNCVVLINRFSYRFLLVDFGLAQCVTADFPATDIPSTATLQSHKRKREEVNIGEGVLFNDNGFHNFSDKVFCPVINNKH